MTTITFTRKQSGDCKEEIKSEKRMFFHLLIWCLERHRRKKTKTKKPETKPKSKKPNLHTKSQTSK